MATKVISVPHIKGLEREKTILAALNKKNNIIIPQPILIIDHKLFGIGKTVFIVILAVDARK